MIRKTLRVALILRQIDQAYDHKSWHGPTLRGALKGVNAETATRRPAPGRHNIWELAVHAAYWKYTVLRRITSLPKGSFALSGSNWFPRPEELSEATWRRDLRLLEDTHQHLRSAVETVRDKDLDRVPPGRSNSSRDCATKRPGAPPQDATASLRAPTTFNNSPSGSFSTRESTLRIIVARVAAS